MSKINLVVIQSLEESDKVKSGKELFCECDNGGFLSKNSDFKEANSKDQFLKVLSHIIDCCVKSEEDWIIHIDSHSYNQAEDQDFSLGVSVAGQDIDNELSWKELHSKLSRLSEKSKGKVLLSLAMCYSHDFLPFIEKNPIAAIDSIITTTEKVYPITFICGFDEFYSEYSESRDIKKAFDNTLGKRVDNKTKKCFFELTKVKKENQNR